MKSIVLSSIVAVAAAQQTAWGQCGGNGWTGATTCISGFYCRFQNEWYSQCLPGTATSASSAAASTTANPSTTLQTVVASSSTAAPTSTQVVTGTISKADGTKFNIDGVTKYYAGTNSYWIGFLTNDADVDAIMSHLQSSGLKILRVWGFNDVTSVPGNGAVYFQSFSGGTATINTGTYGLQRLDAVVKSAENHGIKLIINFVNNWTDYGGMAAYFSACGASSNAQWYQTAKCQTMYQAYIKAVVSRYRTSTGVFAWELANEPRCNGCATSVLTNWIRKTSDYIRSLDSDHMITVGDEGFGLAGDGSYPYQYGEGIDWAANLALPNISFGTFHLYPSSWSVSNSFGDPWVQAHAKLCKQYNKPCLFEEYGTPDASQHCSVEKDWQATSLAAKDSGMGSDLFWQLGDVIKSSGQQTPNDGYTIYYGTSDWTCLVSNHVNAIG